MGCRAREAYGEQRTSNIQLISVTREVSQLSGWLKAVADCRGSQAGHTVRGAGCGPGGGRQRPTAEQNLRTATTGSSLVHACRREGACNCRLGGMARGSAREAAHVKHAVHVRDAGRVPAERLVEGRRGLPRVATQGARGARGGLRATGGRSAASDCACMRAACTGERAQLQIWEAGRGEQRT